MTKFDQSILEHLAAVQRERERRAASPDLMAGVQAVKAYQHKRFEETYADLLRSGRYGPAARFFLDELMRNGTTTALVFGTVHQGSVDALRGRRLVLPFQSGPTDSEHRSPERRRRIAPRRHGRRARSRSFQARYALLP